MRIAAVTYVYNESVNLPIWVRHYGSSIGRENLFVIDRESTDGSTNSLDGVNVIRNPRVAFDDTKKSVVLNSMHALLLQSYDYVIITDCDELIVVDPAKYQNIPHYLESVKPDIAHCIGLNLRHLITQEPPLDLSRPILSQRRTANFNIPTTKPLISSVPTRWQPGGHTSNVKPFFDTDLFVFHTKWMDYTIAVKRQEVNIATPRSERQMAAGHGNHHQYHYERFVTEGFLVPLDVLRRRPVAEFNFDEEVRLMQEGVTENNETYHVGRCQEKYVSIPERFASVF